MLVAGAASTMDSEALNESREALGQNYMEAREASHTSSPRRALLHSAPLMDCDDAALA